MSEWISVKERLPELNERVLVFEKKTRLIRIWSTLATRSLKCVIEPICAMAGG